MGGVKRVLYIASKEFIHIRRDPRSLGLVLVFPPLMLILYGYALTFDIKRIPISVLDMDRTRISRDFVRRFVSSGYFQLKEEARRWEDIEKALDSGRARIGLVIGDGFGREIGGGGKGSIQLIMDGSDSVAATTAMGYVASIAQEYAVELSLKSMETAGVGAILKASYPPISEETRIWYNPELKSPNFMIPGLMAIIMALFNVVLVSVGIVGEIERGTIEQLITSPARSHEFVIGKVIPYIVLTFVVLLEMMVLGIAWFKIPFRGSIWMLLLVSLLFLTGYLGLGLMVSSIASNQQTALLIAFLVSTLPTMILSGLVFPISNMPWAIRAITYIVPARYFISAIRGILLKGVGMGILWPDVLCLLIFCIISISASSLLVRQRLKWD
jgi:ABC-2 type transport system permease protein